MRFEPPEFPAQDEQGEKPLFRAGVSHRPVLLYLSLCAVFFCAFFLAENLIAEDPFALIRRFFLAGWTVSLLLFLLSALSFLYNRIDVTTKRISGRMLSPFHRRFSVLLKDITAVKVSQYFFAGPLHYGRIIIRTGRGRLWLLWVAEPDEVRKALERAVAGAKGSTDS